MPQNRSITFIELETLYDDGISPQVVINKMKDALPVGFVIISVVTVCSSGLQAPVRADRLNMMRACGRLPENKQVKHMHMLGYQDSSYSGT